ncbi:MAG: MEDS domain-containing protein [Verrucomicrobia bacterium]|nr:MEDS domain-containing protein [Verrucomicrobiota bacterium]
MNNQKPTITLGFTPERFPAGVHICQIFSEDSEREEAMLQYLQSGLASGERTCCFSDKAVAPVVEKHLACHGVSYGERCACGDLTMASTKDIYFKDDCFDPERMLETLTKYHEDSVSQGYPAARVIGEMSPEIQHVRGGSRLLEYESKVSLLQREHPVTCVCQYDARSFDGAMIMDVLKVHPLMVIRGAVVRNPFFVPPEEFLSR